MTREEAKVILKGFMENPLFSDIPKVCKAFDMAIKALDQRWIPVSERLPEDGRIVLVWYEYFRYGDYNKLFQTYGLSYAYGGHWSEFVDGTTGWKDLRIIAWMPLPEPYEPTN